ncbi:MAG TPA: hypothetical protein VKV26_12710 [Dehalococcoidia bacterium]|nr:hypothetical protein [Dehalococcoidia bacterium]
MVGTMCLAVRKTESTGVLWLFAGATAAGGATMGLCAACICVVVGDWSATTRVVEIVLGMLLALVAREALVSDRRCYAGLKRQVAPGTMLCNSLPKTAIIWGVQLGVGVLTRVNTWALWAMVAILIWLADPFAGCVLGGVYGLTRGLQLILIARAHAWEPRVLMLRLQAIDERLRVGGLAGLAFL